MYRRGDSAWRFLPWKKVAHDSAVKLFQWRGRTSKPEFCKLFVERMRAAAPQIRYAVSDTDELDLTVEGGEHFTSMTVSLHRAYDEFVETPARRDQILDRWTALQIKLLNSSPAERKDVVPMIKDRAWLRRYYAQYEQPIEPGSARDALYDEINQEFLTAYADYGGGIRFLHNSDLEVLGLSRDELRDLALVNLRTRTPERTIKISGNVWMIAVGGNFDSALMLDDEVWRHPSLAQLDPLVIAAPERNMLIAAISDAPADIWHLAYMAHGLARDAAYAISSLLMIRRNGRFELLDPLVIDESHPIPNLLVIDVFAEKNTGGTLLGITIASALDTTPRSVFRLFRKIRSYLDEIASDGHMRKFGKATPENTVIEVAFAAPAHPEIVELLENSASFVASNGARLELMFLEA
jgi:hypothetical protein